MPTIEYNDGTSITYKEAAQLIRSESKLGVGHYIQQDVDGKCLRCVQGVLEGWKKYPYDNSNRFILVDSLRPFNTKYDTSTIRANDDFKGTREERAEYMAKLFEEV